MEPPKLFFASISAFIEKDDEVICFEPLFDIYAPAIQLNGGKAVRIKLKAPHFLYDWEEVKEKISPRTKLIIVNTPHNPTGKILEPDDIEKLAALVKDTSIVILSDEVYEHMVFDDKRHTSVASHAVLAGRTIVAASLGKVFHCTGWRIGYCLAPKELTDVIRKVHQFVTFSAPTAVQYAMAEFLKEEEHYLSLPTFFQKKRDFFVEKLKETPFNIYPCQGSYFLIAEYSAIADIPDVQFAQWLTENKGVATIPISVFHEDKTDEKTVRFCFAKQEIELEEAIRRLVF